MPCREAAAYRCSVKKLFLEISQNSVSEPLSEQSCKPKAHNFIEKETLAPVSSCEFCKISKNTFSNRTPPVAASGSILYRYSEVLRGLNPIKQLRWSRILNTSIVLIKWKGKNKC